MPQTASEIVVGASGSVYVAPVGTAGPTDTATALAAAWLELGFLSEDGVEVTPGMDVNEIMAWQSQYAVRRDVTGRTLDLGFSLLQWNETNLPFAMGGGTMSATGVAPNIVHTFTPASGASVDERAMVVEWADGAKKYRLHVVKGMVSDLSGFTLARGAASALDVTFSISANTGAAPWTLITNDTAFAA